MQLISSDRFLASFLGHEASENLWAYIVTKKLKNSIQFVLLATWTRTGARRVRFCLLILTSYVIKVFFFLLFFVFCFVFRGMHRKRKMIKSWLPKSGIRVSSLTTFFFFHVHKMFHFLLSSSFYCGKDQFLAVYNLSFLISAQSTQSFFSKMEKSFWF